MAKPIRMPSMRELPRSARRDFVEEIFNVYRLAGRPTLREISDRIQNNHDLTGSASRETIRRVLQGKTVPSNWMTVEAILEGLCDLAGKSPDDERWTNEYSDDGSYRDWLRSRWNDALDEAPIPAASDAIEDDPWEKATNPVQHFNDEPPF